ncbi:PIN domain-containing protein [Paractinoplanes lichenicola]|uniref:PIN domain-containing protein n=1 Tax=Paractinoplanes lichenicola TaxID=2802976 RepID=A0ABS1VRF8_9ACTN|nr:PIN domain-containing protein [Actinoplanes lichenicola]MBL7257303.1 PIN domain-containing protein [Actinoplanes lichenicola]
MTDSPREVSHESDLVRVVLADANVLYSRVLRDYLLYAADQEIIAITWSPQILAEVTEHLEINVPGFDSVAGQRLVHAMNRAFPYAEIEPSDEHWRMLDEALAGVALPDEGDRHVLAAALAAEATVLCTSNIRDFPTGVMRILDVEALTPDQLLGRLITEYQPEMFSAHRTAVTSLKGATDRSTIDALSRAGAPASADLMSRLLGLQP